MLFVRKKIVICLLLFISIVFGSCYRNEINFGNLPQNNYTNLVYTDTVEARLSTVIFDSFATNSPVDFLIGKYKDPYIGTVSTKPFLQLTPPATLPTIPANAQYDSTRLIVYLNKYYYGDTTQTLTIQANEVAQTIYYTYNNYLYNTSNFAVKSTPLGSQTLKIRPSIDDSFIIQVNDTKGLELYSKLQQQDVDLTSSSNFLNYFKGISFSVGANDNSVVYGAKAGAGKIVIRVYYHQTLPVYQSQFTDFTSLANTFAFNQIITDRTNTPWYSTYTGVQEFPSEQTNNIAFTQYGAGAAMKVIFPSLQGILPAGNIVKLLRADLLIKPLVQSYSGYLYLPNGLFLSQTDASNIIGAQVPDSTGLGVLKVNPVIDYIYGQNTFYRFNVTSSVNQLLTTPGFIDNGFFLMEKDSVQINRAIIGNIHTQSQTQLLLTMAVINN